jgi:uncharacterized protein with FMN-binding domain
MIRTTAVPRTVRVGAAAVGVMGALALSSCSAPGADAETGDSSGAGADSAASYSDGTYTAEGSYVTPESVETISVTVTLESDVITAVEVSGDPQARESQDYQGRFIGGISDAVVGQDIDDISVSRVAGSSLTSGGFNKAMDDIRSQAAA